MVKADDEITYPRRIPVDAGLPPGWHGIEKQYGPTSKFAGTTYVRFYTDDGRHKHVSSPRQLIQIHCEGTGEDADAMLAEYLRLQRARKDAEAEERKLEREARGKLGGEKREQTVQHFRDKFGELSGPIVCSLKGWTTRWHYQPQCGQVMVEYIDTDGFSWKLLKDLECAFGHKMLTGTDEGLEELIETARAKADPARFSEGPKGARESCGVYEISADSAEAKVFTQEDRHALREKETVERRAKRQKVREYPLSEYLLPEGPPQSGCFALERHSQVQESISYYKNFLVNKRTFPSDVELLAVTGVGNNHKYRQRICGVYYSMGAEFNDHRCYQKLFKIDSKDEGVSSFDNAVGCDGIYIRWNVEKTRWEVAVSFEASKPVVAYSTEAQGPLAEAAGPWYVQDGQNNFAVEADLTISVC